MLILKENQATILAMIFWDFHVLPDFNFTKSEKKNYYY